jgi:uncharacterized membrane protein YfcA
MVIALASVGLGLVIGLSLGLLGGGGSILTVPALVYVIGLPVAEATGTSLAIVGTTALIGAAGHYRAGRVDVRAALGFGLASMVGAVGGSLLGKRVDGELLLALFALLMIAAGLAMLRGKQTGAAARPPGDWALLRVGVAGLAVGVLTGFFGVGGGFVIVPALTLVLGLPMRLAIGTSLVVIALASAAGLVTHLGTGALDPLVTACFIAGGLAGALAGSRLAGIAPERTLRRGFAALVFVLAGYLLVRNHGAFAALTTLI